MITYVMEFIQNDVTSIIARAYLAQANLLDQGIFSETCLQLAELHSQAMDALKTGQQIVIPEYLQPREYPDFVNKSDQIATVRSPHMLGKLYRQYKSLEQILSRSSYTEKVVHQGPVVIPGTDIPPVDHKDQSTNDLVSSTRNWYEAEIKYMMKKFGLSSELHLLMGSLHRSSLGSVRKGDMFALRNSIRHSLKLEIENRSSEIQTFPWLFSDWLNIPNTNQPVRSNTLDVKNPAATISIYV